jgi:hypothetical protein
MLQSLPEETTQLLIDLCTTTGTLENAAEPATPVASPAAPRIAAAGPSYLSYLALNRGVIAATVLSSETATPPSPSIKTVRADTASRRADSVYDGTVTVSAGASAPGTPPPPGTAGLPPATAATLTAPAVPPVKRLSPRIYFPHFVDHMGQFVVFLEMVALRRWGQSVDDQAPGSIGLYSDRDGAPLSEQEERVDKQDQVAVWNTLLELYLTLPLRSGPPDKRTTFDEKAMRDKAMRVLRSDSIPYDATHALILCSTYDFTQGLVLLWEKMGMYEDVLRFWMDKHKEGGTPDASAKVVEQLMHYGSDHPHLYPLVLRFLTSTPELLAKHQEDVKGILEYIDEEGLIPPLGVIQVLSRNGVASVGLVKEWLVKRIKESRSEIQNVRIAFLLFFPCVPYS